MIMILIDRTFLLWTILGTAESNHRESYPHTWTHILTGVVTLMLCFMLSWLCSLADYYHSPHWHNPFDHLHHDHRWRPTPTSRLSSPMYARVDHRSPSCHLLIWPLPSRFALDCSGTSSWQFDFRTNCFSAIPVPPDVAPPKQILQLHDWLQTLHFPVEDSSTHRLSKITSAPYIDGWLVTLCPCTVHDCDLAHLDTIVRRKLSTTSMSNAKSPEEALIRQKCHWEDPFKA